VAWVYLAGGGATRTPQGTSACGFSSIKKKVICGDGLKNLRGREVFFSSPNNKVIRKKKKDPFKDPTGGCVCQKRKGIPGGIGQKESSCLKKRALKPRKKKLEVKGGKVSWQKKKGKVVFD